MALLDHLFSLGPSFTSRQSTGALASTALEQVEGLHDFYAFYLPQLALAVMIPAAILAFVFPYSWAAGTLLLVTAPLVPLFMILVGMGAESISQRHFQALARMSAYFLDVLQGLPTLKLFNRSKGLEKNIAAVSNNYRIKTMAVLRVAFLSSAVLEFFSSVSIALVAIYLGMSYLVYFSFGLYGAPLSLEVGFFILLLAPDFCFPLRELGTHYHARAMLHEGPLWVLDEPTEGLDPVTEGRMMAAIKAQTADRSLLLITHRLIDLHWMDNIVMLDKGRIAAQGTHEELLIGNSQYASMHRRIP